MTDTRGVIHPTTTSLSHARREALLLAAVAALEVVMVSGLGRSSGITFWWSGVGIGMALLALSPVRRWPVLILLLVAMPSAIGTAFSVPGEEVAVVTVSHAVQMVLGALVLTRGGRRAARLLTLTDLGLVLLAGLVMGLVAAAIEPFEVPGNQLMGDLVLEAFTGHAASAVLLGTAVLALTRRPRGTVFSGEIALQVVLTAAVSAVVFAPTISTPITFLPLPFLIWAAVRFDIEVAATEVLLFAAAVTLATAQGHGPFGFQMATQELTRDRVGALVLAYLLAVALVTLPVALLVGHRHHLLEQSRADERRFRRNFTESPLGMVFLHVDEGALIVDDANAAACTILEDQAAALAGRPLRDIITLVDPQHTDPDALVASGVESWHGRASVRSRPGSHLELAVSAIDTTVEPPVYSAQLLDVTQEHDAHRRLEVALKLTDATLDTTACVIIVTDSTGTIVRINAATKEITGYGESDLLGCLLWESPLAVLDEAEASALFMWPNRSGYPIVREQVSRTAEGEPVRLVWNNNVVHDEVGIPAYAVLTGVDVTAERSSTGFTAHLLQASIATALIGIDVLGRITVFNAGAAQMLGYETSDMVGRPFVDILDPAQLFARTGAVGQREAFLCLIGMIGNREESMARDWTWRTKRGSDITVSMALSVTDDEVEDRVGFLCVGRDVTPQREAQDTLVTALEKERTAVDRLRSLDRAKDEFVSTVSHELRTPVTSILGYTEMLRDGSIVEPVPAQKAILDTISRNSKRLIDICNDLLLLSGFESRAAVSLEPVDLRESVTLAEESARALVIGRVLDVGFGIGTEPLMVMGDRAQLDRVVANLVHNAIKFTPDGGSVQVSVGHRHDQVVMTVADTGIGIAPEDHQAVFQRFYRTETAHALAIPGTGLGLPIVAGIVEAHEGTISLESERDKGTIFTVTLPGV